MVTRSCSRVPRLVTSALESSSLTRLRSRVPRHGTLTLPNVAARPARATLVTAKVAKAMGEPDRSAGGASQRVNAGARKALAGSLSEAGAELSDGDDPCSSVRLAPAIRGATVSLLTCPGPDIHVRAFASLRMPTGHSVGLTLARRPVSQPHCARLPVRPPVKAPGTARCFATSPQIGNGATSLPRCCEATSRPCPPSGGAATDGAWRRSAGHGWPAEPRRTGCPSAATPERAASRRDSGPPRGRAGAPSAGCALLATFLSQNRKVARAGRAATAGSAFAPARGTRERNRAQLRAQYTNFLEHEGSAPTTAQLVYCPRSPKLTVVIPRPPPDTAAPARSSAGAPGRRRARAGRRGARQWDSPCGGRSRIRDAACRDRA